MRRLVIDLADRRPLWRVPEWVNARIAARLPAGWEVHVVAAPADGVGDGAQRPSAEALEAVADAEVYFGFGVPAELLRAGRRLRWVHTATAGVSSLLTPELVESDIAFTNSAGVHAPAVAETVIAMMLHFARGLDIAVRAQAAGRWTKAPFDRADAPVREVAGSRTGVVGYGGIGREVARRVTALGGRVIAMRRRPDVQGAVESGVEVCGPEAFEQLLEASDYVVLAAPETAETRGLVGARELARMKRDAVLINVARGALVDEAALVDALRSGGIRGAGLDVFAAEPLPEGHPLWALPNVLITPHVSAYTHRFWEREAALVEENLARYLAGRPLLNLVDKQAGY